MTGRGAALYAEAFAEGWTPDPIRSVSDWADENRILSPSVSPEPGPWKTSRVPYLREPMDCMSSDHPARKTVLMFGTQLGKTELVNNCVGYAIDQAPGPIIFVEPTGKLATAESKQRLSPMLQDSPCLREKVGEAKTRDRGNTILMKEFPGGILIMVGANSPADLRRMPARYGFCDEVDTYPGDVGGGERGEGDPVALVEKRTSNFPRRKILLTSSPGTKGLSRIESAYNKSDRRRYFVPCPFCGYFDWIRWENIRWTDGDPSTARLACVACEELIGERYKTELLERGQWRPTAESTSKTLFGYHLSGLYSPLGWKSWSECVQEFLDTKDDVFEFKVFVNTVWAETWEDRGDARPEAHVLAERLETREDLGLTRTEASVPHGVGLLVASADVQGDRLELQVKGYGAGEESWLIDYQVIYGDPGEDPIWFELDELLKKTYLHESGREVPISCVAVDSGGHHTEQVYRFTKPRIGRRVFAVKGSSEQKKPILPARPTDRNNYRAKLWTICVDTAKEVVYSRLKIQAPGPKYCHLPDWVDEEYLEQLTAEKLIRRWVKNRGTVRDWIKLRERNEALDLEVYALAALYILGQTNIRKLPELADALSKKLAPGEDPGPKKPRPRRKKRKGGGWIGGWKD